MFPTSSTVGHWLYAVGLQDGRIKIGRTGKPRERFSQHRKTYGDAIAWVHLGPRIHQQRFAAHMVERRAIEALAEIGVRIARTEVFLEVDKATALRVLRDAITQERAADAAWESRHARPAPAAAGG